MPWANYESPLQEKHLWHITLGVQDHQTSNFRSLWKTLKTLSKEDVALGIKPWLINNRRICDHLQITWKLNWGMQFSVVTPSSYLAPTAPWMSVYIPQNCHKKPVYECAKQNYLCALSTWFARGLQNLWKCTVHAGRNPCLSSQTFMPFLTL